MARFGGRTGRLDEGGIASMRSFSISSGYLCRRGSQYRELLILGRICYEYLSELLKSTLSNSSIMDGEIDRDNTP